MTNEMSYLTDEILRCSVEKQSENEFDTHDIIFTLMSDYSRNYGRQLCECLDHVDPFVKLHTHIGQRLASKKLSNTLRQLHRKRRSRNCRGKDDECEMWVRA